MFKKILGLVCKRKFVNFQEMSNILKKCLKFKNLNSLYCIVHDQVGHMNCMSEKDVNYASQSIHQYISHFRKLFPNSVTPKIHF